VLDSLKLLSETLITDQGEMRILVENAKDGFITLETEYAMHYGNKKLKVSSLGKIRSNLPTTLSVKNLVITNLEPSFSLYTHQIFNTRC